MSLLFIEGFEQYGAAVTRNEVNVDILRFYSARTLPTGATAAMATSRGTFQGLTTIATNTNFIDTIDLQDGTTGSLTCIIGFYIKTPTMITGPAQIFRVYNGAFIQANLRINVGGTVTFQRGGTTDLGTSTFAFAAATEYYVEFKVIIGDTTNGSLEMRVADLTSDDNATPSVEFTVSSVDTRVLGTAWTNVRIYSWGTTTIHDDIYIANAAGSDNNDYLGNIYVEAVETSGTGTDTDFTPSAGSNYQAVDDTPSMDDDTTYNETSTATDSDLYAMSTITESGTVLGVQVSAGVRVTAGTNDTRLQVREGTTTGEGVSQTITSTSYVGVHEVFENNPDTSAAWSTAEIGSMESGIKLQS